MVSDIYEVEVAPDGTVWVGAGYGDICQFDPVSETCLSTYDEEDGRYFTDMLLDGQGRLIFATNSNVQILEGGATTKLVLESDVLASNFVDSFALDPAGTLWVGTDGGTQRLDPADPDAPWETFKRGDDGPGGNWANEIYILPDGSVWLAIINGSLSTYDGADWTVYSDYYSMDHVAVDAAGRIWLGDEGDGITILDGADVTTLTEDDGLPSNYVRSLLPDGEAMWIGTTSGLALYRDGQLEVIFNTDHTDVPSHSIGAMLKEADGTLLLGGSSALMRYDLAADKLTILLESGGDSPLGWYDSISDVALGKGGRFWVSTYGGLLYSDNGGSSWVKLTTADGLPTNNINAIFADQFGSLWVAGGYSNGGGGLARYVP
jgi:ligand-binding sensor domain-containing protein